MWNLETPKGAVGGSRPLPTVVNRVMRGGSSPGSHATAASRRQTRYGSLAHRSSHGYFWTRFLQAAQSIQGDEEMGLPERAVTALARVYSMSEVLGLAEPAVREELDVVASCERTMAFQVVARGIAVDGELLDDSDGSLAELSRDLDLAGVTGVRLAATPPAESVESFIRSLRDGVDELRQRVEGLPDISVFFRRAPGEPPEGRRAGGPDPGVGTERSTGFARTVAEIFPEAEWASSEGNPPAPMQGDAPKDDSPDLVPLVDAYLESEGEEREERERDLREGAAEAAEMDAWERVAEAVERLILEADPEGGREEAVDLARDLFGPDVAAAIVRRLGALRDDADRERRIQVATTLRGPMASAFSDGLAETDDRGARHAYLDALVALGEDGRAEARRMLEDSRWWVIRNGATILGGTGIPADVEDLTTHLAHDDARVRLQTVRALAHIGGDDAGMLLLGMVDDPDPDVRAAVATALGALGPERAVKSLLERLETEEEQKVEIQIVRALGALGDPGAVPSIEKRAVGSFFSRPPVPVRVAAYRALASIGTPRATQLLEDARDDRDDEVRRTVRGILERRGE